LLKNLATSRATLRKEKGGGCKESAVRGVQDAKSLDPVSIMRGRGPSPDSLKACLIEPLKESDAKDLNAAGSGKLNTSQVSRRESRESSSDWSASRRSEGSKDALNGVETRGKGKYDESTEGGGQVC